MNRLRLIKVCELKEIDISYRGLCGLKRGLCDMLDQILECIIGVLSGKSAFFMFTRCCCWLVFVVISLLMWSSFGKNEFDKSDVNWFLYVKRVRFAWKNYQWTFTQLKRLTAQLMAFPKVLSVCFSFFSLFFFVFASEFLLSLTNIWLAGRLFGLRFLIFRHLSVNGGILIYLNYLHVDGSLEVLSRLLSDIAVM